MVTENSVALQRLAAVGMVLLLIHIKARLASHTSGPERGQTDTMCWSLWYNGYSSLTGVPRAEKMCWGSSISVGYTGESSCGIEIQSQRKKIKYKMFKIKQLSQPFVRCFFNPECEQATFFVHCCWSVEIWLLLSFTNRCTLEEESNNGTWNI